MTTTTRLALEGCCDIHLASRGRADLLDALRGADEVEIDAGRAEHLDLTFVQLLIAASKTADASQRRLRFTSVSPAFLDAFARAGVKLSPARDQIVLP